MQKKFLTTDEIVNFYGINADVVQSLVDAGDLKALADRGTWKYRREEVETLIKSGKLHPTKELPMMDEDSFGSDLDFPVATDEKVDFLELDEAALAPADSAVAKATSSSDVVVVLDPTGGKGSDSDIHLRGTTGARLGESSIPTEADQPTLGGSDHVLDETLDESAFKEPTGDSGITLEKGDSGITLEAGDSGISLAAGDSGISLEAGDSGISLSDAGDSAIPVGQDSATEQMELLDGTDKGFQLADESSGSSPSFKLQESASDIPRLAGDDAPSHPTAIIAIDEDETAAPLSFSGAVAAGESVDDLEVMDALTGEDSVEEEVEEVLEASDEAFDEELVDASGESEEYLAAAPVKAAYKEPSWGALAGISVIAASVLLAANAWLVYEGLNTMWTGAAPSGLASTLISTLAGLM
jgi:hypothetical protein